MQQELSVGVFHSFLAGHGKYETGEEHTGHRGKFQMVGKQRFHNAVGQQTYDKNAHELFRQLHVAEVEAD